MANTNKQFQEFDINLSIPVSKKEKMANSREFARKQIESYFKKNQPDYPVSFWIQGSHKNSLNIRTEEDDCDQDDGVYIDRDPNDSVDGTTLQKWIFEALKDITNESTEHRKKCIRNNYKENNMGTYHIDYPSYYYQKDKMKHPLLTVKNELLEESDPQEFTEWLNKNTDEKGQLRRNIRYLKAWCDSKSKEQKMLNGLTMTVLSVNNFVSVDNRDDESLYKTLLEIHKSLKSKWTCIMPATPNDDLLRGYDQKVKDNFIKALSTLIDDAKKALDSQSNYEATKLWKKHLGHRFPLAPDDKKSDQRTSQEAIGTIIGSNKPYFNG